VEPLDGSDKCPDVSSGYAALLSIFNGEGAFVAPLIESLYQGAQNV
jgi:hypothetical protein